VSLEPRNWSIAVKFTPTPKKSSEKEFLKIDTSSCWLLNCQAAAYNDLSDLFRGVRRSGSKSEKESVQPGVDVMITIFGDFFPNYRRKKLAVFLKKTML
jgi:hypothetical protein